MPVQKKIDRHTAVGLLEIGQLSAAARTQTQGMGDIDLESLVLQMRDALPVQSIDDVVDANLSRTIDGASTLTVDLVDDKREILRSGKVARGLDVQIDGLWFRLVNPKKTGKNLALVFEDRIVNILRTYSKKMGPISRSQISRAEFVVKMLDEVQEFQIPYFIPQLTDVQPVGKNANLNQYTPPSQSLGGVAPGSGYTTGGNLFGANPISGNLFAQNSTQHLTSQSAPMSDQQIKVANQILETGVRLNARRKVLVVAIMTAIQESNLKNIILKADPGSPVKRAGVFRQDPRYWPASRDVVKDATAFYSRAIGYDRGDPAMARYLLAERVQNSGQPLLYAQRNIEADRIVTAFGVVGGDNEGIAAGDIGGTQLAGGHDYFYYRGKPPAGAKGWGKEDTWTCIQRLAGDVQWRGFMVGNELYFLTEEYLFRSAAAAVVTEDTPGIDYIDFDADENKAYATVEIGCWMKRWAAPPGTVIYLKDMGPVNGRYLVTDVNRSLFREQGTITCKKPMSTLPEPPLGNLQSQNTFTSLPIVGSGTGPLVAKGFLPSGAKYVQRRVDQGRDFETDPGGPIIAPGAGKVVGIGINPLGFGTSYPIVYFSSGPFQGKTMYIGHCLSSLPKYADFVAGQELAITGTTGQELWNGNASVPGWAEIGYAPNGVPGPWGQDPPF